MSDCRGANGIFIINILIFNQTIAENHINISNKESLFEYNELMFSVEA